MTTSEGWDAAIVSWAAALRSVGRPVTTVKLREYQLGRLARAFGPEVGPWDVTGDQLEAWMGTQVGWESRETIRSFRAALRGFYRWGHGRGRIAVDPALALMPVKPMPINPRPTPEDVFAAALGPADDRVRLMLRMAGEGGMRRAEVAVAHQDDLARDLLGWTLEVHGKGGKTRLLPITDELAALIRARGPGYLFPGRIDGHLSPKHVGKLAARALPGIWAMHSLRHRFCTVAYEVSGHDIVTVQELAGHASIETTRRYVRADTSKMRRTVVAVGSYS